MRTRPGGCRPAGPGRIRTSLTALLLGWAGLGLGASGSAGAAAIAPVSPPQVDAIFAPWDKPGSPGAALAVIHDGRIVYERGYGRANLEHEVAITPETVFYVGSVSKQFAAAAVALLARQGALSLDDDVRRHVPELPDYGRPITLRNLIHHTSGLRDYLALRDIAGESPDAVFDDRDVLALLTRQQALNFPPGSQHLYSNSGYFLLSVVVRRVAGKSLRQFAAENIFLPLGMKTAQFRDDHRMLIPQRADGYAPLPRGEGFRLSNPNFDVVGAGGVFMTVRDFLAWDENFHAPKVGDAAFITQLLTPGKLSDGQVLAYAFGLMVGTFRGQPIVEHSGAYGGFRAHVLRFPAQRFSVACFTNLATMEPGQLARRVATLYIAPHLTTAENRPPAVAAPGTSGWKSATTREHRALAGEYFSRELQTSYRIVAGDDRLALQRGERAPVSLQLDANGKFHAGPASLTFQRDASGRVTGFSLDSGRVIGLLFERRQP